MPQIVAESTGGVRRSGTFDANCRRSSFVHGKHRWLRVLEGGWLQWPATWATNAISTSRSNGFRST